MHLECKNDILPCFYRYIISQLFEIRKQKQNTSILETLIGWRKLLIFSWRECLLKNTETIIWYFYACFIPLKWKLAQYLWFMVFKKLRKN